MKTALIKWLLYLVAILAIGPGLAWMTGKLVDIHGGDASTLLLTGSNLTLSIICLTVCLVTSAAISKLGAKLIDVSTGLILGGICLAWAAWPLATLESAVRLHGSAIAMNKLAIDNLLSGALGSVVAWYAAKGAMKSDAAVDTKPSSGSMISAVVIGALAAAGACYLVANAATKGQSIAGAAAAGIAASVVIQFMLSSEKAPVSPLIPMVSITIVACAAPVIAGIVHAAKLEALVMAGNVLPLARPVSLDWPAGGLIGAALGLSWSSGAMERHS